MNVLFLSLIGYDSINDRDIYTDLLREFIRQGHKVYLVSPAEKERTLETGLIKEKDSVILRVKTGNIQKTGMIEKGISTILLKYQFVSSIKKYFRDIKFDLVLYSTPPITIANAVGYVKKRDCATTYLMLKDIFPQNALDIGILTKNGLKGLIYKYFRRKEKKLYSVSDYIGCMSQANVDYLLKYNQEIQKTQVEICPNCVEVHDFSVKKEERIRMREKYEIPQDKTVFLYGGNLGKPQGINFMLDCFKSQRNNDKVYFLVIGSGTEFHTIKNYVNSNIQSNVKVMNKLPKEDYIRMVGSCDVGMLFLDYRFTIPNFPSRIVDYMQAKLPVIACTDINSDIGSVIVENGFGWWCESNDVKAFENTIEKILDSDMKNMGEISYNYLNQYWNVIEQYQNIKKTIGWDVGE